MAGELTARTAESDPQRDRRGGWRARWEWALIGLGGVVHLASPHFVGGDGEIRHQTLVALLHGHLSPARYGLVQSVLAAPLYGIGALVGFPRDALGFFNAVVLLGGMAAAYRLLRERVPGDWLRAFLLLVLAASMFPHHSQWFYGEVLTAVALFLGLLLEERGRARVGGAAVVVGVLNTPAAVLGAGLSAFERWRRIRRPAVLLPIVAGVALVMLEFWARRGNPFDAGYGDERPYPTVMPYAGRAGFTYPLFLGLLGQTLSFGKGIVFFAPGVVLLFSRARERIPGPLRDVQRRSLLVVAGLLLAYAKWWMWFGGRFWGPRFVLFAAFPASVLLAGEIARPRREVRWLALVLALVLASVWVGASGALFGLARTGICKQDDYFLEALCIYTPEYSPLLRPFIAPPPLGPQRWAMAAWFVLAGATLAAPPARALAREVRSWWMARP